MSYKDINLSYIDGILQAMREEYQTRTEVPLNLRYHIPKDYTIEQKKQLSKKVKSCWLASEEELEHVESVAAQLKQEIVPVSNIYMKI